MSYNYSLEDSWRTGQLREVRFGMHCMGCEVDISNATGGVERSNDRKQMQSLEEGWIIQLLLD